VLLVAPGRSVQPAPLELQRRHWYAKLVGSLDQLPDDTVSV